MDKIVVIGASGHAKVIIDIINSMKCYEIVGCTDLSIKIKNIMGYPVLGADAILPELYESGVRCAFVAIGDNKLRFKIYQMIKDIGFEMVNAISSCSVISSSVQLGKGIAVMPGAIINADTIIGDCAIINTGATVDHDCSIGSATHIAPGTHLAGNVKVGKYAFLGVGSSVIPQVNIGEDAMIGAGSVVIRDVPQNTKAVGNPAKEITKIGRID